MKLLNTMMIVLMLASIIPAGVSAKVLPDHWERSNELPSMLGVEHYVDLYITSDPRYLDRDIYWDETDHVHSSVSHGYYDTVHLEFEDWVDNSWDDVKLNVWSDPESQHFAVQVISTDTAARDPVHFKLGFAEEKTIVVEKPRGDDSHNMDEVETYTGRTFDIVLWDDMRDVEDYDFRIIKILEEEEEPEDPELADLIITNVEFVPPQVSAQEQVYFDVTVKNQGEVSASPVTIRAYELLTTAKTSANEDRGSAWSGLTLEAGESRTQRMGPYSFSAGTHQLMFKTDYLNAVEESDENNNDYYTTIEVEENNELKLPDLLVESISISPSKPSAGEQVSVKAVIKNQGQEDAYGVQVYLYEALNANYDKASASTKKITSVTLSAGESTNMDLGTYSFDEGIHQLMATVDPFNNVKESNEVNNDKYYSFNVIEENLRHIKKEQLSYLKEGESVIVDDWNGRIVTLKDIEQLTCTGMNCDKQAYYTIENPTGNTILSVKQQIGQYYYTGGSHLFTSSIGSDAVSMKITDNIYDNNFQVWLSPSSVKVEEGETAKYKLTIRNLQEIPTCPTGASCSPAPKNFELELNNIPYKHSLPEKVMVGPGQSKTVSFTVNTDHIRYDDAQVDVQSATSGKTASYAVSNERRHTLRVSVTEQSSEETKIAYGYLTVQDEDEPVTNFLKARMTPTSTSVEAGEQVKYKLILHDQRPSPMCSSNSCSGATIKYDISTSGLPFANTLPKSVQLSEGEYKEISFVVYTTKEGGYAKDGIYTFSVSMSGNYGTNNIREKVVGKLTVEDAIVPPTFPEEQVEIELKRGWNLISIPGKLERFLPSDCTNYKKLLGFVLVDGDYMTLQEAQEELGDEFAEYISTHAVWIYAYENCELVVEVSAPSTPIKLDSGWNLIPVRNEMVGQKWSENFAGCGLERVYEYHAEDQKWKRVSSAAQVKKNDIGTGFAIKVEHSCSIGELIPPNMPYY